MVSTHQRSARLQEFLRELGRAGTQHQELNFSGSGHGDEGDLKWEISLKRGRKVHRRVRTHRYVLTSQLLFTFDTGVNPKALNMFLTLVKDEAYRRGSDWRWQIIPRKSSGGCASIKTEEGKTKFFVSFSLVSASIPAMFAVVINSVSERFPGIDPWAALEESIEKQRIS